MAGKNIAQVSGTITAVGGGYVTLASVAGYYKNAIVYLNDSTSTDANNKRGVITDIDVANKKLGILFRSTLAGETVKYGRSDMTPYNGGSVTQLEQFIYNTDEAPLT